MPKEEDYLLPSECEELADEGYPQGKSEYLWHNDKRTGWELYKRNQYDMSDTADRDGFNRWTTAITHEQAKEWRDRQKPKVLSPVLMTERVVSSLTFLAGDLKCPRRSACIFATSCHDDLINISETRPNGYLHVTVYFWKDA